MHLAHLGAFSRQDYGIVPVRILNHVGRQLLGMPPVLFAAPPSRKETDAEDERRIRTYLGLRTFDDAVRREFSGWLRARAVEGVVGDELVVRAERHLFSQRVVVLRAQLRPATASRSKLMILLTAC